MSQNTELVQALQRLLKDSEFVIKTLAENSKQTAKETFNRDLNIETINESNYKDISYYTDTTSGLVIEQLFELRENLIDSIDQYDF